MKGRFPLTNCSYPDLNWQDGTRIDHEYRMLESYEQKALAELNQWQLLMQRKPSLLGKLASRIQTRINRFIPQKVHNAITVTIKQMVRAVLSGAKITTPAPKTELNLEVRELLVREKIDWYKKTAAAEGGLTGAGGILLGLADFPLLLAIKIKLLFEIASLYGYSVKDYKERIYILYIFQLAFSSQERRRQTYDHIANWNTVAAQMPEDIHQFDWMIFQQEYRDYLDLAKMAQLIPVIGAPVGFIVNYKLVNTLGKTAMNAYRMRIRKQLKGHDEIF